MTTYQSYDVVIATRNRPDALKLSVASIIEHQKTKPKQLIIVDSSDEVYDIENVISSLEEEHKFKITFIKSDRANLCYQRNIGLKKVTADVTIFPDDDSIFYPGAIDEIMRIYRNDDEGLIAGVCAAESITPPSYFPSSSAYKQTKYESIKKIIAGVRYRLEQRIIPDPFHLIGQQFIKKYCDISWFNKENVVKVEFMTGFRMSFKTSVIKSILFNNVFDTYCLYEDTDASFSAYKHGILAGARNAKIYHHKYPSKRGDGYNLGLWQILNRIYVIRKHSENNQHIEISTNRFLYYKLFLYLITSYSKYGRDRFSGALYAMRNRSKLYSNDHKDIDLAYKTIIKEADLARKD